MGATYTRQSSFTDGDVISAADSNDEFDQLLATFQATSGHTHDGTPNEGGPITTLLGSSLTFGSGADSDITISFNTSASDGEIKWLHDGNKFQFSDDVLILDDEQLIFGSDSNVAISYDETTTDSLKIAATEGAGLAITLMADEGDDAGDEWKLNIADGGTLTLGNDIASAGSYVTHLTLTPNSTVASSTLAVAGNLTVGGSLTLGSGAELAEAELEMLDGITAGTVAASKAMVVDANKDIGTVRNLTIDGTFSDGNYTFDTSGNVSGLGTVASGAITSSGIIKTDDATDATTTLDGSLQTDGGLSVAKDAILGNDVKLLSDSAVLSLGAGNDITFTHDGTTGLTIAATPISIDSTGELHLNSTIGDIKLQDGGVDQIAFDLDGTSGEVIMKPAVDSDDLVISQFDGTEVIRIEDNASLGLVGNKLSIANSSSDVVIKPLTDAKDIIFQQFDGTVVATVEDNGTFNVPTGKLAINSTAITSTAAELNLLDTASANSVVNSKAVIYGSSGELAGTLSTAAQSNITSVGTLTALTVDEVAVDGKVITMTGSSGDTFTTTVGTNGATSLVTVDTAGAAAHLQITADGTVDIDSAGVLTLDSGAAINIEPASGSAILLDGTISIDAGVVTGATSITSTAFVGDITGDVTGNADTATALATARTIGGTSFDGTGNIAVALASVGTAVTVADESSDTTCFPLFTTAATGDLPPKSGSNLTFNSSSGLLTATSLAGTVATATQNSITTATGLVSVGALDSGSITSNFGNIDNGASNVTSGGLVKLDVDSDADDVSGDSATGRLTMGAGEDLNLYHGGTNSYIVNDTGELVVHSAGGINFTTDTATFTSVNSTDPVVIIKNTTNDTSAGRLHFVKDKGAAGADGDDIGTIEFISDDSGQAQTSFAKIVAEVSESANTDEAGKLSLFVAESDGTNTALTAGLILEGEHATDGQVDVTIGAGAASTTTIAGVLDVGGREIILDADDDTSITADTDDQIDFKVGGTDRMSITSSILSFTGTGSSANIKAISTSSSGEASLQVTGETSGGTARTGIFKYDNSDVLRIATASAIGMNFETSDSARLKILSGGNTVTTQFFKGSNATDKFYNGTDPSSGNWHEFNSTVGNDQILAITAHATGTSQQGFVIRHVANTSNTSSGYISCANDVNGTKFVVKGNGDVQSATNSYGSTSDERLKSDIKDANSQWNDIKQFKFKNFKKYDTEDLVHLGLIAQEAEKISPNIVSDSKPSSLDIKHDASFGTLYTKDDSETQNNVLYTEDDQEVKDGDKKVGDIKTFAKKIGDVKEVKEKVKEVKYSILYMKAVKALQEAMTRIETLETKVKALEDA